MSELTPTVLAALHYGRGEGNQYVVQADGLTAEDCYELSVALWLLLPPLAQVKTITHLNAIRNGEVDPPRIAAALYNQHYATRTLSFGSHPDMPALAASRIPRGWNVLAGGPQDVETD